MKKNIKTLAVFMTVAIIVTFMTATMANADGKHHNKTLQGDYAFTGSATCVTSPAGFNPDLTPRGGWYYESFSIQGAWTFNHDGTGIRRGRGVSVTFYNPAHAGSFDIQALFTYTIGPDNTIVTQLSMPLTGQVLTGSRAGQTFSVDQITLKGLLGKDKEMLTLASEEPEIETATYSNGNVLPRICQRSRVLLLMHPKQGHNR